MINTKKHEWQHSFVTYFPVLAAGTCFVIAVAVICGWYLEIKPFVQIKPNFAPMQFNTALCFCLSSAAFFLHLLDSRISARILAFITFAISGLTLSQYILQNNIGIDELFMDGYVMTKTSHPGRMAPNTAISFMLMGAALCCVARGKMTAFVSLAIGILIIALLSMIGYIISVEGLYGLGTFTRMAIHTMIGFLLLSTAMLVHAVMAPVEGIIKDAWLSVPYTVSFTVLVLTVIAAVTARESVQFRNEQYFQSIVMEMEEGIEGRIDTYEQILSGLVAFIYGSNEVTQKEWSDYVYELNIEKTIPGARRVGHIEIVSENDLDRWLADKRQNGVGSQFVNHPETNFKDKYLVSHIAPFETNADQLGFDMGYDYVRRRAAEQSAEQARAVLSQRIASGREYVDQPSFLLFVPVYSNERSGERDTVHQKLDGWVYVEFAVKDFLSEFKVKNGYQTVLKLYDSENVGPATLIYDSSLYYADAAVMNASVVRSELSLGTKIWSAHWQPSMSFAGPGSFVVMWVVLFVGALLAGIVFILFKTTISQKSYVQREVTKQTQALEFTQKHLRLIMDTIPDMVFVKDSEGRIVDANPAFLELYAPEDRDHVIGFTSYDKFPPEEVKKFKEQDQKALLAGYTEILEDITDFRGFIRRLMTKKVGYTDSQGKRFLLAISRDVTSQLEIEEQLRVNQERFDLAARAARVGLWDWRIETSTFYFNEEWYTILGYEPYELPVRFKTWKDLTHPEDLERTLKALNDHLEGKVETFDTVTRMRRKDGNWAWINIQGKVFERNDAGEPLRVAGIQIDVSELKNNEIEADIARKQAKRASELKGEFLANMSHEIRTPMNGILGMAELLEKSENINDKDRGYIKTLLSSANALLTLIDDILDFSKMEAGKLTIDPHPCDIEDILGEITFLHSVKAKEKGIDILLDISADIPALIKADDVCVRQIVNNFVSNAIKFTNEGFITIKAEFKKKKSQNGELKITVSDTGIGMDQDEAARVFNQFEQAKATTTREFGGTGLGLTICEQLVHKMKGDIGVDSQPDVGSSFYFSIPVDIERPATKLPKLQSRILIIDRFSQLCAVLKGFCASADVQAVTASTVFEASLLVDEMEPDQRKFDAIVVDSRIVMDQVHDAQDAYDKFPKLWNIPWILMTESYEAEAIFHQDDRFAAQIRKPVRRDHFLAVLYDLLASDEIKEEAQGLFDIHEDTENNNHDIDVLKGARILLVDDSPVNLIVAEQTLEDMQCDVTTAANGREAVEAFSSGHYDLILMDCRMPIMDGYQATQAIRRIEKESDQKMTPVIALTAGVMAEERQRCFDSGMNDFLSKPVRAENLERIVLKWLKNEAYLYDI